MTRLAALVLVTAPTLVGIVATPAVDERPNVLVIYADDLGYGDLGVYGHHTVQTLSLDRLASEGMRFTSYYAPSALCSPSRAGLLTGRTPFRTGIQSWIPPGTDVQLGAREVTIATLMRGAGYQTAMAGKWHLNGGMEVVEHTQPDDHGFDHWLALHAFPVPHNRNPRNFYRNGVALGEVQGFTADIVVDEAIEWLHQRDPQRPFFLYVPMIEPHATIANPPEFNALYDAYTDGHPDPLENGLPAPPDNLAARGPGEYYANITYMDHQIGRLLKRVDELGLRDDTLVFFASDNGPVTTDWRRWWEVNLYGDTAGLRGRKHELFEGGIRVPAIVRWPGTVTPGGVSDAAVSGYDLLPTLAALVGFDVPADRPIDGEDMSALLGGETWERSRPLYWEFDDEQGFHFALRDGDWKLLIDQAFGSPRLYDLGTDRFELFDRATERPEVVARLAAQLRQISASVIADPLRPR